MKEFKQIVKWYGRAIINGIRTIEKVPKKYKEEVKEFLEYYYSELDKIIENRENEG